MTNDRGVHGDVEGYVLGALDESDRTIFENHLEACPACQREVVSYLPVLSALREVPLPPAPPMLAPSKKVVPFPRVFLATAAVVILTIGGFGGSAVQRMLSNDMITVAEMGVNSAENVALHGDGVKGRAIVGAGRRRTAFVAAGLPQPGPNQDYQVWITGSGTSSAGILHRSIQGYEVLLVPGDVLRDARSITITLEGTGGSRQMTGRPVLTGAAHEV
jgi:anti-sigma-K factor RskA